VYPDDVFTDAKELFTKVNFFIHGYPDIDDKERRIEAFITLIEQLAPKYWLAEQTNELSIADNIFLNLINR
jgi:hypothetical protein